MKKKSKKTLASLLMAACCVACGGSSAPRADASAAPPESGGSKPVPPGPGDAASLPPGHPPIGTAAAGGPEADRSAGRVAGTVQLSPKLAAGPTDVLYLIAKKGATTLAVRRIEKPAFPLDFELTGADAMVSGVPFEGPVDLVARLSRSGDAIPAKGDLEGVAKGVAVPASGVQVTIDTTRS